MIGRIGLVLLTGALLLAMPTIVAAGDPDWWIAKDTWWETMWESLNSVSARAKADRTTGFKPFTSEVLAGGDEAQEVKVSIVGVKRLSLVAQGVPDYQGAHADWADARLIAADGCVTHLSDLKPFRAIQPYGTLKLDKSHRGGPLLIAGESFARGLGTHAPSEICFLLDGKYEWFEARIGVDVTAGSRGHVRFSVVEGPSEMVEDVRDALWRLVEERFPDSLQEINWEREDGIWNRPGNLKAVARRYADACSRMPESAREAARLAATVLGRQNIEPIRRLYLQSRSGRTEPEADQADVASVRMAVLDLMKTFPQQYTKGRGYLKRLDRIEKVSDEDHRQGSSVDKTSGDPMRELAELRREALLGNPLLDFDRLLLVKRRPMKGGVPVDPDTSFGWDIGLPRSSFGNSSLPKDSLDDEIAVLSPVAPNGKLTTLYKPEGNKFVGDVDLHFSAERMLFSMRDADGMFRVYEIKSDGSGPRQVCRGDQADVDEYDACYLPDGRIVFAGTGCFQGVPCNMSNVAVLYRMDADGSNVRQLCFEQDHDFNPCMLPSGRLLYTRWEYSDLPHSNSRMMFSMNPDGTAQMEYYGSGSYWPNSIFGARPIPHSPNKFIGIVAGHHGSYREGGLVLFDVGQGRREADGVVQRIPGHGRTVAPIVRDQLTAASWPKFAHPYPLSDKYFLVTCKLDSQSPWDIYLVDVFDNLLPLYHLDVYALFEPIPLRKTDKPPVIPDRVDPKRKDAVVHLADIYRGGGLAGVPRGTVKELRLFTYHFAYQGMGGLLGTSECSATCRWKPTARPNFVFRPTCRSRCNRSMKTARPCNSCEVGWWGCRVRRFRASVVTNGKRARG